MLIPEIPFIYQVAIGAGLSVLGMMLGFVLLVLAVVAVAIEFGIVWVVTLPLRGLWWLIHRPAPVVYRDVRLADLFD